MPTINAYPQRPQRDRPDQGEVEAWAMPLGRVGGIEFQLCYSVFVAFAVLAGIIAMVRGRDNNADLPMVAMIGAAFWAAGWLVQVVVHCFLRFVGRIPIESLTIGLLGIESRTRSWSAKSALLTASATLFSIVALGGMFLLAENLVLGPRLLESTLSVWGTPGFGLASRETVWLAGAWLCWIQAICQMYPLPKSLGRLWLVAAISLLSRGWNEAAQTGIAKRFLRVIAVVTAIVALASIATEPNLVVPRWPLLLLLSVLLWISAHAHRCLRHVGGIRVQRQRGGRSGGPGAGGQIRLGFADQTILSIHPASSTCPESFTAGAE